MKTTAMGTWRRLVRRLGTTGVASLALALAAAALFMATPYLEQRTEELKAVALTQSLRNEHAKVVTPSRQPSVGEQIDRFVANFPPLSQHPDDLQRVFASAAREKVMLPRGEYQFRNDANAPLVTVTASFPITADYPAIKSFAADVLTAVPHASMDELRMNRDGAGGKTLESLIRFSFVYRRS
jgi:hypothetical protein